MNTRLLTLTLVLLIVALAACAPDAPTVVIPTLADLPTATPVTLQAPVTPSPPAVAVIPSVTPLIAQAPTGTPPEQQTLDAIIVELTLESAELATGIAEATNAAISSATAGAPTATETPTAPTDAPFITFTPSDTLDVTYTPFPTRTATGTPTPLPEGLELLALLSAQFTVLPPEIRYNPPTQTALAIAVTAAVQTAAAPTATATLPIASVGGGVQLATLPGANGGAGQPLNCAAPPPQIISSLLSAEPALLNALGCPIGAPVSISGASQTFERGTMVYLAGSPGDIYVLSSDTRFRRYPDTWVGGVDPDSGGQIPPPGLTEPIRGFGKVWRTNPDVQASLGWATGGESGTSATLLIFERGRAVYLPSLNQTFILIADAGTADSGTWRTLIGAF